MQNTAYMRYEQDERLVMINSLQTELAQTMEELRLQRNRIKEKVLYQKEREEELKKFISQIKQRYFKEDNQ